MIERRQINKFETISDVLCGSDTPKDIVSGSNDVRLTFISDEEHKAQGFKIDWTMGRSLVLNCILTETLLKRAVEN